MLVKLLSAELHRMMGQNIRTWTKKLPRYTQYIQSNFVDSQFVYFDSRLKLQLHFPTRFKVTIAHHVLTQAISTTLKIFIQYHAQAPRALYPHHPSLFSYIPLFLPHSFFLFSVSFSLYTYALQSWIGRTFGTAFGMNPEVGGSSPHWVEIFLSQKLSEDHPFVSQKWMLLPVCSWHFKC